MFPKQEKSKDGSDFDDFLTKTIGAPSKKIDHAETTAPKRPRRNIHAETSAPKPPHRNVRDAEFSGQNKFQRPYLAISILLLRWRISWSDDQANFFDASTRGPWPDTGLADRVRQ